jgi:predicted RNA-binding Zn ribbon-like protein
MNAPDSLPFEFGGRLSLDFTWTLRYRSVYPTELLTSPDRLAEWLTIAELPSGRITLEQLEAARSLREAIYAAAIDAIDGKTLQSTHLATINEWSNTAHPSPQLRPDRTKTLTVRRGQETNAALTILACDTIELIATTTDRLRRCEGPNCSLLFHDTSRPGQRRWCSAQRCGNKINTKNYRARL